MSGGVPGRLLSLSGQPLVFGPLHSPPDALATLQRMISASRAQNRVTSLYARYLTCLASIIPICHDVRLLYSFIPVLLLILDNIYYFGYTKVSEHSFK